MFLTISIVLLVADTAYMMNEQDSSSGIASDDHTQHSSPTFSTFKEHPNATTAAAVSASIATVMNGGGGAAGRRRHRITYQETDLDDINGDPHFVVASAVEEEDSEIEQNSKKSVAFRDQHSDYASDTSDTLRTSTSNSARNTTDSISYFAILPEHVVFQDICKLT